MADQPATPAPAAPAAAPAAPPAPSAPQPPPAGKDSHLSGKEALALFQDLPPAADPAKGEPPKQAAADPAKAGEPPKQGEPPKTEQDPALRKGFTKLAEGQAELRRQQTAHQSLITEAQGIVDWFKSVQQDPTKLFDKFGPDLAEKLTLARAQAGQPKSEADRLAEIEAWKAEQERLRNDQAQQQTKDQQRIAYEGEVTLVEGWLKEAGGDRYETLLGMGKGADGLTGPQKVHKAFVQFYMPRYGYDPKSNPESTTKEILLRIADEVEKQETEEIVTTLGKVKKVTGRFAPAPAAGAPPPQQPQAPPPAVPNPAPAAPAPPTLNGRHAGDAAPPASRRKSLRELDEDIAARFWPS